MIEMTRTTRRAVVLGLAATACFGPTAMAQGLPTVAVTKERRCPCPPNE